MTGPMQSRHPVSGYNAGALFRTAFTPKFLTLLKNGAVGRHLKQDLVAGLTVAIVALPLAMALGIASGASPDKGLITAVIAGFLISFLGGSRVQVGGPTGAFVVVIFNIIAQHGYDGLVLATLMAGIILLIAGFARLGQVIRYIPHPVITGFTAGIAVIIATSQVKDFFGLRIDKVPADFLPKWASYFEALQTLNPLALCLGVMSLLLILILRKHTPRLPGYLIAVALSALITTLFHLPVETIGSRFPALPHGLPMPHMPVFSFEKLRAVLPASFTIAFLAGIEALLSAVVADGMTGYKHRPNQELVGQGVANIASALFGGLPATGAIARTATNVKSGGQTPMAGIFHALFLLLFLLAGMDLMAFIPMSALAAILFVVAWGMSEMPHFIQIFKLSASERTVLLLTFFLTVLVDLTVAIGVGVTLASLLFVKKMSESVEIMAPDQALTDQEERYQRQDLPAGVEVFEINGPLFFGMAGELTDTLQRMGQMPRVLILRLRHVPLLDSAGVNALKALKKRCESSGTRLILSALQDQPAGLLARAGLGPDSRTLYRAGTYAEALALAQSLTPELLS